LDEIHSRREGALYLEDEARLVDVGGDHAGGESAARRGHALEEKARKNARRIVSAPSRSSLIA
jgi:hypothetical protein